MSGIADRRRIWDVADDPTRDLIVTMQVCRLLGDLSVLPPQEAAGRAAAVITESLRGALSGTVSPGVASEVMRRFTVRVRGE